MVSEEKSSIVVSHVKLQNWIRGIASDTSLVVLVASHLDVAVLPPVVTPGVFHQPVFYAVLRSVTSGEDAVIQDPWGARVFVEDATRVVLEMIGIDGHGDGTHVG